ncbi:hypothetical protein Strain138_002800 [Pseudogemmatithrix spongiicola]|uniref:Haemolysin activator HlyB C-terminal domain-containing protein n=1 Tax=Pseudogemmatithrix spongiicola TaxID=3062599 RepID=A0AA49JX44_9BACT|nr:hypothetical protein Strain138_002800 [Gemmatimonadaceae bacterium 'strain 138']WKW16385.1 hypothetical protein Strain318_002800 [Gemmatimonadaceae bacterium 'strain 318']
MVALGLLLAFQVTVQVNRDSSTASGSISVRPPSRERIAVTDEHRRTAFKDNAARELLLRARAARLQQDSSLYSYEVKSYQRISAGMSLRETARERLVWRGENASRVRWQRGRGARVEVLGARMVAPITQGIKEAEAELESEMASELDDMLAVPYYPGKDQLWLFEMVGSSDNDGSPMLIHPVAEGSEAYFTFASGDSVDIVLPDGKRLKLRELIATPRRAVWNLVVGSFWFETESAQLARAVMRFSAPMDIWETVEAEDPDARKDMPAPVRGMLTPMRAEITAVTIEYGLFEQRYWLPRTQGAEGYARVSFMRVPFRIEQRYRYESVNGFDDLPEVPRVNRVDNDSLTQSFRDRGLDSAAVRDSVRAFYAAREELFKVERAAGCARTGTYRVYETRGNGALSMAVDVPCDMKQLTESAELPPSIYDPGEELFGAAQRDELMRMLDFGLQPAWAPRKPTLEYGLAYTRYNRIEGFGTGARMSTTLGKGYSVALDGRASGGDLQLNGGLSVARSNGRTQYHAGVFRRLNVSSDFGDPLSFGASLPNLFYARDEGFYHRSWGAELTRERVPRGGLEWRVFAEQQWNARVDSRWSLFGGANDDRFLGNVVADTGWFYGAGLRWRGSRGLDPRGWRMSADLRLEGATGQMDYGRAFLETIVSRGLGPVTASVTAAAGTSEGELPAQRQFFLGGLWSVRGQTAGTGVGEAFWLSRVELGTGSVAARPVLFGDLGWAGPRDGWNAMGRPMSGVGVGASFFDGMARIDLSRGMHPRWQTRLDLYLEARF